MRSADGGRERLGGKEEEEEERDTDDGNAQMVQVQGFGSEMVGEVSGPEANDLPLKAEDGFENSQPYKLQQ